MKQRIVTGLVAALLFLPLVLIGGLPFVLLIYLMATIAFFEIMRMKKVPALSRQALLSVMMLWLFLIPSEYGRFFASAGLAKEEYLFALIFVLLMITVATKNEVPYETIGFCLLTVFYLGIGFYYMMEIRAAGLDLFLYALFVIWATDIGAYFFGRSFGKRKLWPEVSPKKTVEGSAGGTLCALLVGAAFYFFPGWDMGFFQTVLTAFLLSVIGQIGDLVESALKRAYHVKDSGNILPGHGGILDRVDSWLFVMPFLHFFLIW